MREDAMDAMDAMGELLKKLPQTPAKLFVKKFLRDERK